MQQLNAAAALQLAHVAVVQQLQHQAVADAAAITHSHHVDHARQLQLAVLQLQLAVLQSLLAALQNQLAAKPQKLSVASQFE